MIVPSCWPTIQPSREWKAALRVLETGGSVLEKGLIPRARELGIVNLLIDPGVVPMGSGAGASLRFSVVAKARLGLPVGSGIHNAVSAWPWLRQKEKGTRRCCDAAAAAMQLLAAADFLLYGPIENSDFIFPAAAMADILVAEAVRDLDILPGAGPSSLSAGIDPGFLERINTSQPEGEPMYLSREEEEIYRGDKGETLRRMMEILVALGDIFGAERLVPVRSAQIAGVSFKNIGEAGLEWISDLQGPGGGAQHSQSGGYGPLPVA